jgi:hypothetical protein
MLGLLEALVAGDEGGVAAALRGRSEADRRETATELVRAVRTEDAYGWARLRRAERWVQA